MTQEEAENYRKKLRSKEYMEQAVADTADKIAVEIYEEHGNDVMDKQDDACRTKRRIKMQNKMTDLKNHLFEQMENLLDKDVCKDKETTESEIGKTNAMIGLAGQIIEIGRLQVQAVKVANDCNVDYKDMSSMLLLGDDSQEKEVKKAKR